MAGRRKAKNTPAPEIMGRRAAAIAGILARGIGRGSGVWKAEQIKILRAVCALVDVEAEFK